jgi:endonuclease/exonuclease/phosphatase family metal-dependent hydrolase
MIVRKRVGGWIHEDDTHAPRVRRVVRLIVRSWNIFHGRTCPETGELHAEEAVRRISQGAPDVVCLQELPVWALRRLGVWSQLQALGTVTMAPLGGPLARRLTELHPERLRSAFSGQANAVLVSRRLRVGDVERLHLNPCSVRRLEAKRERLPLAVRRAWGRDRRVAQLVRVAAGGETAVVLNLHLTTCEDSRPAGIELLRAADYAETYARPGEPIVLCGDLNLTPASSPALTALVSHGFSPPLRGIDHILVRSAGFVAGPAPWPEERRRHAGALLSDHAPLEAEIVTS